MTNQYLKEKFIWDAVLDRVTNLARAVRNGDKDLADELEAGREVLRDIKAVKQEEHERVNGEGGGHE